MNCHSLGLCNRPATSPRRREGGREPARQRGGEAECALLFGAAVFHMTFFFFSLFPFPRRIVVTRPKCMSAREREQDVRLSDVSAGQGLTPCCNCVRKLETVFVQPMFQRGEREVKVGKTHSAFRSGSLRLRSEILANHGHAGRAECVPSATTTKHMDAAHVACGAARAVGGQGSNIKSLDELLHLIRCL